MMYVATLIANVPNEELSLALTERIEEEIDATCNEDVHVEWVNPQKICKLFFDYGKCTPKEIKYPIIFKIFLVIASLSSMILGFCFLKGLIPLFSLYDLNKFVGILLIVASLTIPSLFWKYVYKFDFLTIKLPEFKFGIEPKEFEKVVYKCIGDKNIDFIIQPLPPAPKKLLISDMDSTMIEQECIDELADFVGKKAHVAAITERAMNGELVFEDALRERVALLSGLSVEKLQECFDTRITAMGGAKELVAAFKKQGGKAVLVSGGFTFFTERVAKMLGFDEHYANVLEIENGKLTGKVREPILGKEAKLAELHRQCEMLGITPENVIAIGDGANDLPMLKAAGLGIAYHAKPSVQAQVNARINHNDLGGIIHLL